MLNVSFSLNGPLCFLRNCFDTPQINIMNDTMLGENLENKLLHRDNGLKLLQV